MYLHILVDFYFSSTAGTITTVKCVKYHKTVVLSVHCIQLNVLQFIYLNQYYVHVFH